MRNSKVIFTLALVVFALTAVYAWAACCDKKPHCSKDPNTVTVFTPTAEQKL